MVVDSLIPEDASNACPYCDAVVKFESSLQLGDSSCPACRQSIWFVSVGSATIIIKPIQGMTFEEWIAYYLASELDLPPDEVKNYISKATASRYN